MGKMDRIRELVKMLKHSQEPDSDFDRDELEQGINVEKEHSDSPVIAKAISKAHLDENPKYYDYLDDMEKKMNKDKRRH